MVFRHISNFALDVGPEEIASLFFFYYFIYFVINGVHLSVVIYEHIRLTLFHEEVTNKEPKRNNTHASFHTFSYIFGSDIKIYIYIYFFSFAEGDFFSIFGL